MSRFVCSVIVVVAGMAVIAAPASAAPDEDFVVGTGEIAIPSPPAPTPAVLGVAVDAHSDASGGNPSGTFSMFLDAPLFAGPVTCLIVTGNTALIGFEDFREGHLIAQVVDNSATGSPDTVGIRAGLPGCSGSPLGVFPVVSGDFVVHDAVPLTSKDQCKDGGWRDFTDDQGRPFESQGQCIAFVQHAT
jgi:hypothetical protein